LLRLASFVICVIVLVSFLFFALDQTKAASGRQQAEIAASSPERAAGEAAHSQGERHSQVRSTIEEISDGLTSPFTGVVAASSGEWAVRAVKLGLALLLYGFGLGYLARVLRVRV
jgi:hypothetical protein